MGRPSGVEAGRRHDRPSVVRRRARTGQSPDPRAADICPVGPRAAPPDRGWAPRSSPGVVRSPGENHVQLGGLPVEPAVTVGTWVTEAVGRAHWSTVGSLVPPSFPAYARVLHPAYRYDGDDDVEIAWAEV